MEQTPACCQKKNTQRTPEERSALTNRLSRMEGQLRGIRSMVERGDYCTDILTQSAAVSAALDSFNRELLASHIRGCVARDIRAGDDQAIEELLGILRRLMR